MGHFSAEPPTADTHRGLPAAQQLILQVAVGRFWREMGVAPCWILGLGRGELAAACLAGVLSLPDALRRLSAEARSDAAHRTAPRSSRINVRARRCSRLAAARG